MKSKIPDPGSGAFYNMAMEQAWEIIEPVMREVAERYISQKQTVGTLPPTWQGIKTMPVQEAVDTVIRIIRDTPFFRTEGQAFAKRIIAGLEGYEDGNV